MTFRSHLGSLRYMFTVHTYIYIKNDTNKDNLWPLTGGVGMYEYNQILPSAYVADYIFVIFIIMHLCSFCGISSISSINLNMQPV